MLAPLFLNAPGFCFPPSGFRLQRFSDSGFSFSPCLPTPNSAVTLFWPRFGLHPPSWLLVRQMTKTILDLAELGNVILLKPA